MVEYLKLKTTFETNRYSMKDGQFSVFMITRSRVEKGNCVEVSLQNMNRAAECIYVR